MTNWYTVAEVGDEYEGFTFPAVREHETYVILSGPAELPLQYYYSEVELEAAPDELEVPEILPENAALRKEIPIHTGFVKYFPDAIAAVAKQSYVGGLQHGQTLENLHWDRTKSTDHLDAMMRHIVEEDWVAVAWRAMANLQQKIEEEKEQC